MRKLVTALFLFIVLATQYDSIACRQISGDGQVQVEVVRDSGILAIITTALYTVERIPIIGGLIQGILQFVQKIYGQIEALTNGGVARALGGALPCKISEEQGFVCTGVTEDSDISKLIMRFIDDIPGLVLPGFVKSIIKFVLRVVLNPVANITFGGILVNKNHD